MTPDWVWEPDLVLKVLISLFLYPKEKSMIQLSDSDKARFCLMYETTVEDANKLLLEIYSDDLVLSIRDVFCDDFMNLLHDAKVINQVLTDFEEE
jgi:hypothetical protein